MKPRRFSARSTEVKEPHRNGCVLQRKLSTCCGSPVSTPEQPSITNLCRKMAKCNATHSKKRMFVLRFDQKLRVSEVYNRSFLKHIQKLTVFVPPLNK